MHPAPPAVLELAVQLRFLRREHWPDSNLTQAALARALGQDVPVSPATVASWENRTGPKRSRLRASDGIRPVLRYPPVARASRQRWFRWTASPRKSRPPTRRCAKSCCSCIPPRAGARCPKSPSSPDGPGISPDSGPLTLVCTKLPEKEAPKLADPADPNYTQLAGFGDLDAVMELHGHVRAENPGMNVYYKGAPDVKADDLSGHVVIIGGIAWNDVMRRLIDLSRLPVRQEEEPGLKTGDIFSIQAGDGRQKYLPQWSAATGALMEDVGLLVRMPNPLNSNRTITMCNGIHSRGVLGAVRTLTDARLRESNEQYIARNFPETQFGILMRVTVIEGETLTPDFHTEGTVLYQWPDRA